MNKSRAFLWPMAAVLMAGLATGASQAPTLTFHFKDVNFPGAAGTSVYGINDAGVIVGQYYDKQGVFHGFKLDHGKGTTIDDPNGSNTLCSDINSNDVIVGQYTDPSGDNHGFLYENGKFTDIAPDKLSGASGINNNGYIVGGYAHCQFCQQHGFLWNGHKFKRLDVPGAMWTGAGSINDSQVITIIAPDNNNHYHSYLYRKGKYAEVKVPGAFESYVEAINNGDDLSFSWIDAKQNNHAALRYRGRFYKYDHPRGKNETLAFKLNNQRQIVGDVLFGPAFLATY